MVPKLKKFPPQLNAMAAFSELDRATRLYILQQRHSHHGQSQNALTRQEVDFEIDGSQGEGGGQVLRTSLTLSCITGKSFKLVNIRGKRPVPGLQPQHLVSVNAARVICNATVLGCEKNSITLEFYPQKIMPGNYRFDIGTAGSCTLVLQTVIPILWFCGSSSSVVVIGGTHNPSAPSADFFCKVFAPLLPIQMECSLDRYGFYPAGGGQMHVNISYPFFLKPPLELMTRGKLINRDLVVLSSNVKEHAKETAQIIDKNLIWKEGCRIEEVLAKGKGGPIAMALFEFENLKEMMTVPYQKRMASQEVATQLTDQTLAFLNAIGGAPVDEHLADQLLLPLVLKGGGRFRAVSINEHSMHFETNRNIITRFLGDCIEVKKSDLGGFDVVVSSKF